MHFARFKKVVWADTINMTAFVSGSEIETELFCIK